MEIKLRARKEYQRELRQHQTASLLPEGTVISIVMPTPSDDNDDDDARLFLCQFHHPR